jgi:hypothetical protein
MPSNGPPPHYDTVVVNVNDPPRLLIKTSKALSPQGMANLRESVTDAFAEPRTAAVFQDGVEVFQFVDGRWVPLATPPAPAELKHPILTRVICGVITWVTWVAMIAAAAYFFR